MPRVKHSAAIEYYSHLFDIKSGSFLEALLTNSDSRAQIFQEDFRSLRFKHLSISALPGPPPTATYILHRQGDRFHLEPASSFNFISLFHLLFLLNPENPSALHKIGDHHYLLIHQEQVYHGGDPEREPSPSID